MIQYKNKKRKLPERFFNALYLFIWRDLCETFSAGVGK